MVFMEFKKALLKLPSSPGRRLVCWWLLGGFAWIAIGALLFSFEVGLYLGLYAFAFGPVLAVILFYFSMKFQWWGLTRYRHQASDELTKSMLKWHLKFRGPRPELWIYPSIQPKLFLFPDFMRGAGRQHIVISHAFLRLPVEAQRKSLESVWIKLAELETKGGRVFAGRLLAWFAILSPLVFVVELIDGLQGVVMGKFRRDVSQWVQPFMFQLKASLLGAASSQDLFLSESGHPLSLLLGFWEEGTNDEKSAGNSAQRELKLT